MSTGNHLPGCDLFCWSRVHDGDKYVKLQDMQSKTTVPVSNSMHLILNKQCNKCFTEDIPASHLPVLHIMGTTENHIKYMTANILSDSPNICAMIMSDTIHRLRHSILGVYLWQLLITLVTNCIFTLTYIIQEQAILNTPALWVRQPELGSNSIRTEIYNTQSCTACTIHSQYIKQVCETWSTILTNEHNLQTSENKVNWAYLNKVTNESNYWFKIYSSAHALRCQHTEKVDQMEERNK
jgi:hypothetical protein